MQEQLPILAECKPLEGSTAARTAVDILCDSLAAYVPYWFVLLHMLAGGGSILSALVRHWVSDGCWAALATSALVLQRPSGVYGISRGRISPKRPTKVLCVASLSASCSNVTSASSNVTSALSSTCAFT